MEDLKFRAFKIIEEKMVCDVYGFVHNAIAQISPTNALHRLHKVFAHKNSTQ